MGVPVRLTVYAGSEAQARAACRAAFDRFAALEQVMSDYRPTSACWSGPTRWPGAVTARST